MHLFRSISSVRDGPGGRSAVDHVRRAAQQEREGSGQVHHIHGTYTYEACLHPALALRWVTCRAHLFARLSASLSVALTSRHAQQSPNRLYRTSASVSCSAHTATTATTPIPALCTSGADPAVPSSRTSTPHKSSVYITRYAPLHRGCNESSARDAHRMCWTSWCSYRTRARRLHRRHRVCTFFPFAAPLLSHVLPVGCFVCM